MYIVLFLVNKVDEHGNWKDMYKLNYRLLPEKRLFLSKTKVVIALGVFMINKTFLRIEILK